MSAALKWQIIFNFLLIMNKSFAATASKQQLKVARLINGNPISPLQAPYQASIRFKAKEEEQGYGAGEICGGVVVSQRMIITAASCLMNYAATTTIAFDASYFTVVLGSTNRYQKSSNALQYNVQQVIPNPNFDEILMPNDIGIMFIDGYIPWNSPVVKAIPLSTKEIAVGTNCTVTGWGKAQNNETLLMSLTVPIMNNATCFGITLMDVPECMICAGFKNFSGVNACAQDKGDPLICNGALSGIVARNNGCGLGAYPGYYTNVTYFYNWIITTNSSFDYNHYSGGVKNVIVNFYMLSFVLCLSTLSHYLSINYQLL